MAQKTATLYARIEPSVKQQAEEILSALGISASSAINMFYKQIILRGGIPFDVVVPQAQPSLATMTTDELSHELEKGYEDMQAGRVKPAGAVFDSIRRDYEL